VRQAATEHRGWWQGTLGRTAQRRTNPGRATGAGGRADGYTAPVRPDQDRRTISRPSAPGRAGHAGSIRLASGVPVMPNPIGFCPMRTKVAATGVSGLSALATSAYARRSRGPKRLPTPGGRWHWQGAAGRIHATPPSLREPTP
jgi:hypothetical protein